MQLKKSFTLSSVAAALLLTLSCVKAENYVSVEYLQYNESDDRVSVSSPMLEVSYDFNADYNLKINGMFDAVSGATPTFRTNDNGDLYKGFKEFEDRRNAASLLFTSRFENRDELYAGLDYSREKDYQSYSASLEYMHYLNSTHNTSFSIGASLTSNEILVYDGVTGASDYSHYDGESGASHTEDSMGYNLELGVTQVLSEDSSMKLSLFTFQDDGYLTNQYERIVRDYSMPNARLSVENRPDKRVAYGFTAKYNKLLDDGLSFVGSYRFYSDDWDMTSNTVEGDIYKTLSERITLGVGLRYYTQTEASFYSGDIGHFTNQTYASSDERLSDFDALTYKASLNFNQNDTLSYNIGAEFYKQNTETSFSATMITIGMKYRF